MSTDMFRKIRSAGIRLLGYGTIAVCAGIAALAYVRLVLALNDQERADAIHDALAYGISAST
ncbi:MAG: hypothetical protein UHD09_08290 [Bifidobacterium sp.]|nr:hypothetical protein [Bifidobacterium sp.]